MTDALVSISRARSGERIDDAAALALCAHEVDESLLAAAEELTLAGFGVQVTYSRKVFIPLTKLCRDVCHYCTFATTPRALGSPYLAGSEVSRLRGRGAAGCREALFTLGDEPELRYSAARAVLSDGWVHRTTLVLSGRDGARGV